MERTHSNDRLNVTYMNVGDMVFIYHHQKPYKSGWYRLTELRGQALLLLEIPVVPTFYNLLKARDKSILGRVEDGLCAMHWKNALENRYIPRNQKGKYEFLFIAHGLVSSKLINYFIKGNRLLPTLEMLRTDLASSPFTPEFTELCKSYEFIKGNTNKYNHLALIMD